MLNDHGEFELDDGHRFMTLKHGASSRQEAIDRLVAAGVIGICDVCGKPFRREGKLKHAKRCSMACSTEAGRRAARERGRARRAEKRDEEHGAARSGAVERLARLVAELQEVARELGA